MIINLSSKEFLTINDFFKTLQECIFAEFGKENISFFSAYPNATDPQVIKTPIITYYYRQGLFSFQNTTELKGRRMPPATNEIFRTEQGQEILIEFIRQRFDYDITLEIWESSGFLADELAEKTKKLISSLLGYFKRLGLNELFFMELDGTQPEKKWKTDLTLRTLKYKASMDEITSVSSPTMSAFGIEGFVYKSILHLFGKKGAAIDKVTLEQQVENDIVASSTPNVATIISNDDDVLEIRIIKNDE